MSVVFAYVVPENDLSQLHDELLAAGLAPERVEGLGEDITLTFPDGQAQGPVDDVVAVHVPRTRYDPATRLQEVGALLRESGRAALRAEVRRATTVDDLRDALLAHLQEEEEEEEET